MRIGFDVSQTGKGKAGCGFFAYGLIRELAEADTSREYILYPAVGDLFWDPDCATETFTCERPNFRRLAPPRDFAVSQRFWRSPADDFESQLGQPDIFHSNNFYSPRGLKAARLVYTLYDLSFLEEPAWSTEANRVGCFQGMFQASVHADFIVAISQYTRQDFRATFPHYPEDRMAVVHPASRFRLGAADVRPPRFSSLEPGKFWLTVGTIEPRKNHARLLQAYQRLKVECGQAYPLVIAGGNGWLMDNFESLMGGLEPERDVVLPGYVSDRELCWLYRNCYAFVYPSLFEGFGMPVLEAMELGAPVLCSNTSSLPEVVGEAGVLFDPWDSRAIAAAMVRLARGELNRESLITAGIEQARRFSWSQSAAQLCGIYDQVLSLPRKRETGSPLLPR